MEENKYMCPNCETDEGITYLKFANKLITWCENCDSGENLYIENNEEQR